MEHRMKTHPLTEEQMDQLLGRASVGRFATLDADGFPYAVPVHFVLWQGKIYLHGLPKGEKLQNLARNNKVCFEADEMLGLLCDGVENPCDVNTQYNSVILRGTARLLEDPEQKAVILREIVAKYTPHLSQQPIPEGMIRGTGVVEITPVTRTGKYYA